MTQRLINFRALKSKNVTGKTLVYGHFFQTHERPGRTESWIIEDNGTLHLVYPETLGQFTGLFDKSGKEIWEKDIYRDQDNYVAEVIWEERSRESGFFFGSNKTHHHVEVIGNVFSNPDLLKN